jgi:hypothetical protein
LLVAGAQGIASTCRWVNNRQQSAGQPQLGDTLLGHQVVARVWH